ncbi:MAG: chalcone isomerase family protein [Ectothiorhodospiraceae bacterium]|nr:chalcone isomerase family protein [Ectothiorhodospiraceae bacterium]
MHQLIATLILGLALAAVSQAAADTREVEGVELPERIELADTELLLNGAGVRTRFFVRVYVGALYTSEPVSDGAAAIAMEAPRRIHLELLRNVGRDTMVDALVDGLDNAMSEAERVQYADEIDRFKGFFGGDFQQGDRGTMDAIPGIGLVVSMNGEEVGRIESDSFAGFVLAIWLGEEPADRRLKRGMLGGG